MCELGSRPALTPCLIFKLTRSHLKIRYSKEYYMLKMTLVFKLMMRFLWWTASAKVDKCTVTSDESSTALTCVVWFESQFLISGLFFSFFCSFQLL